MEITAAMAASTLRGAVTQDVTRRTLTAMLALANLTRWRVAGDGVSA